MARMRKFIAWRRIERPYTRTSKFRKKAYIRARPNSKVVRYHMGDQVTPFDTTILLRSKVNIQIRDAAMESARQTSNRHLQKYIGKTGWRAILRAFPHHILRENPLAAGAGADRMSTGMKRSFGKTVGIAAQVKKGQAIYQIDCPKKDLIFAKEAIIKASKKLPCSCIVEVIDNTAKAAN